MMDSLHGFNKTWVFEPWKKDLKPSNALCDYSWELWQVVFTFKTDNNEHVSLKYAEILYAEILYYSGDFEHVVLKNFGERRDISGKQV